MGLPVTRVRKVYEYLDLLELRDDLAVMAYMADLAVEVADSSFSVTLMMVMMID